MFLKSVIFLILCHRYDRGAPAEHQSFRGNVCVRTHAGHYTANWCRFHRRVDHRKRAALREPINARKSFGSLQNLYE